MTSLQFFKLFNSILLKACDEPLCVENSKVSYAAHDTYHENYFFIDNNFNVQNIKTVFLTYIRR